MNFQKIIFILMFVVLFIVLIFIGVQLKAIKKTSWPPNTSLCPDYWLVQSDNAQSGTTATGAVCKSLVTNTGTYGNNKTMDFTTSEYTSPTTGACSKYNWTQQYGVLWDTISSGNENPCIS
jgi:hypothetical protein